MGGSGDVVYLGDEGCGGVEGVVRYGVGDADDNGLDTRDVKESGYTVLVLGDRTEVVNAVTPAALKVRDLLF